MQYPNLIIKPNDSINFHALYNQLLPPLQQHQFGLHQKMSPLLICVLFLGISLGTAVTNNNNNFGPGPHINNNNNYGSDDDLYEPYSYFNPYYFFYSRYRNKYRHPLDNVNNNGGGSVNHNCPYGANVNNNGPGQVQIMCLPPGVPSNINNNG